MNIMLVAGSLMLGGAERQIVNLANELTRRHHRVTIVAVRSRGLEQTQPLLAPDITIICLKRNRAYDFWFLWKMVRAVQHHQPDVLYSFLSSANIISGLMRPVTTGKIVWGIRSARRRPDSGDPLGYLRMFWTKLLRRCPHLVISNSEAGRALAIEQGMTADKVVVVPNGIDIKEFRIDRQSGLQFRQSLRAEKDELLVGIVASIRPVKDHITFFKAAAEMKARGTKARFLVVGEGNRTYVQSLLELVNDLDLADQVKWLGKRTDLRAVYNGLDILISSSLAEGFSNVVAEAMACGTPAVVTDVGDSAIIVGHPSLVAPVGDWHALAQGAIWATNALVGGTLSAEELSNSIEKRYDLASLATKTERALISNLHFT